MKNARLFVRGLTGQVGQVIRRNGKLFTIIAVTGVGCLIASAQSDMSAVVSDVSGYWDAAKVVAIGILLFVIGRKVIKKI